MLVSKVRLFGFHSHSIPHGERCAHVSDSDITLRFVGPLGEPECAPIIKALYPTYSRSHLSAPTDITHTTTKSVGLSLGYDPYGSLHVDYQDALERAFTSTAHIAGSGVETNVAMFTSVEDPAAQQGVDPALDFAVMVALPSEHTRSFEVELSVEATVDRSSVRDFSRGSWFAQLNKTRVVTR